MIVPDRVNFSESLSANEIKELVANTSLKTLQTDRAVKHETWDRINHEFLVERPDVEIRVYGFYGETCDLSFVKRIPNVRRFSADCLMQASGVEHVGELPHLGMLHIGIYDLLSFGFLGNLRADQLTSLGLYGTASKKPDLSVIGRFSNLQTLYLESQSKHIEVLSQLKQLEDLTLRSVTVQDLSFLTGLSKIWSLDIKLGGTKNLAALAGMTHVKYLELWAILGLSDLSPISGMTGLQNLFLQSLPRVNQLPDFSRLTALRRIDIEDLKALTDTTAILTAPALEEFIHAGAKGFDPTYYEPFLQKRKYKSFEVFFGSQSKNRAWEDIATRAGIPGKRQLKFEYR